MFAHCGLLIVQFEKNFWVFWGCWPDSIAIFAGLNDFFPVLAINTTNTAQQTLDSFDCFWLSCMADNLWLEHCMQVCACWCPTCDWSACVHPESNLWTYTSTAHLSLQIFKSTYLKLPILHFRVLRQGWCWDAQTRRMFTVQKEYCPKLALFP